ncbi:MAG: GGDEF domain-containing protein [Beduini sp.]|uniref:GGDEF domain-containing protein n=1 Tax=Beduini sp. TaxID=1922300 RepID=UPI003990575C
MLFKRNSMSRPIRRMDVQVSIFTAAVVTVSCLCVFAVHYFSTYHDMIRSLNDRVLAIYDYLEDSLDREAFSQLRSIEDMNTPLYQDSRQIFANVKQATDVRYLYTATQIENGDFIYLIDGLPLDAEDFRHPGDLIEKEIIPELQRAMNGETIMPSNIKETEWGKIFIAYLPIHSEQNNDVVGVVGIEFDAAKHYNTYKNLRLFTPIIILGTCLLSIVFAVIFFRRISNPLYRDMANTDHLTQLKNRNAYLVDTQNLEALHTVLDIGILVIDLNNLKTVNDELGHDHGDTYLQVSAQVLLKAVERNGTVYRIGGDEFAVLVPHADEKMMKKLESTIHLVFSESKPDWSINIGLAIGWYICTDKDTLQSAFNQADTLMYKHKKAEHQQKNKEGEIQ